MSKCETEGRCETTHSSTAHRKEECCPVEKSVNEVSCPVECAVDMWQSAFFQGMKELQIEIIKEKARKAFGDLMEKEGDAVVKAMGTHWESMLAQAKAQCDLREEFKSIFEQKKK